MHLHMMCEVELTLTPSMKRKFEANSSAARASSSSSSSATSGTIPDTIPLWHLTRHHGYEFLHPKPWAQKLGPILRAVCKVCGIASKVAKMAGYPIPDISDLAPEDSPELLITCAKAAFDTVPGVAENLGVATVDVDLSGTSLQGKVALRQGGQYTPTRLEEF